MKKIKNSDKYCDNDNVYKAQFLTKNTAWKVSKYGDFSGPCFPVFSPNTGKYE